MKESYELIDANELIKWAATVVGCSISITFNEGDGSWTIETISPAEAECYYIKRAISNEHFISCWTENLEKMLR